MTRIGRGSSTCRIEHGSHRSSRLVDLHNHLVPGVDDGAADLEQTRAALAAIREQGVSALIATPHLSGALTLQPERLAEFFVRLDAAWEEMRRLAAEEFPEVRVERGVEVMLDTPAPDLSDPRTRLAGTSFVLMEFPFMAVPPNGTQALSELKVKGWTPVIAHPERYANLTPSLAEVEEWRRVGAHLQVNSGSLLGRYGGAAQAVAWRLLERGWVDYLSSDYHARGRCAVREAVAKLHRRGGEEQARLLTEENPARLLAGEPPERVPPLAADRPWWQRVFGLVR